MGDWIKLLTAVFGLLSAVVVYNKTKAKTTKVVDMGDDFKTLKSTFNVVGTIALIMIIFFGFFLGWFAFFRLSAILLNYDKPNVVEETKTDDDITNNRIAFNTIRKINSRSKQDEHYLKLLEKVLIQEEDDLVINIITSINSNIVKTDAINMAFDYYIDNKKYFFASSVIVHYNSYSAQDEKNFILLDKIYQD